MEVGLVHKIDIDQEMQLAYMDYAMSVIVARALPDARDGLKPVHRRILYAMHDMGLRPDSAYKKSARIVGEVLGKYHPHGDMAVYESMARMAQDFSMRYRLVDGQGNFGSVDGDPPAAMRYTEARLTPFASEMLLDIAKNTVDFDTNFDGSLQEPRVLPAAVPNLLVNGATGIAVGMATSIPPHNLVEVVDALHYMIERWDKLDDIPIEELMQFVQGPDFPTGGIIIQEEGTESLISAYSTGRGRVTVRASAHLEEMERGRNRIIVTELPYMTNKSSLIERIASLVREERLEGIADLRDESDRQGMRIVIELTKAVEPEKVLSNLYKSTPMQSTFSIIMLALVEGEPRMLGLKQALRIYIEHRLEIVRRRSEFDLERARQRAHILEGLRIALSNLDEIISLIRKSPDAETARERMMKRFKLTLIQAQAILDMQLRRLAALERKKIEDEYRELLAVIKELEALLKSPKRMREVVDQELQVVKTTFGDRRRTHIAHLKEGQTKQAVLTATDLKADKMVWLSVTPSGLISRSLDENQPRVAGKDAPFCLLQANTRDILYLVSEGGEAAAASVHTIPEADDPQNGVPLHKACGLKENQPLAGMFSLAARERRKAASNGDDETPSDASAGGGAYIVTVTAQGMIKKSALAELPGPTAGTITLVKVNEGDRLVWLGVSSGQDDLLLATRKGMAIRFTEADVRPMGLAAAGVLGIKLANEDAIAGAALTTRPGDLFLQASDGSAKRVALDQFPRQGRYGQGITAWKLASNQHLVGAALGLPSQAIVLHLLRTGAKWIHFSDAPLASRAARGHAIVEVKGGNDIERVSLPWSISVPVEPAPGKKSPPAQKKPAAAQNKTSAAKEAASEASKPASKPKTGKIELLEMLAGGKEALHQTTLDEILLQTIGATTQKVKPAPKVTPSKTAAAPVASKAKPAPKSTAPKETPAKTAATPTAAKSKPAPAKSTTPKATTAKTTPAPEAAKAKPAVKTAARKAPRSEGCRSSRAESEASGEEHNAERSDPKEDSPIRNNASKRCG